MEAISQECSRIEKARAAAVLLGCQSWTCLLFGTQSCCACFCLPDSQTALSSKLKAFSANHAPGKSAKQCDSLARCDEGPQGLALIERAPASRYLGESYMRGVTGFVLPCQDFLQLNLTHGLITRSSSFP